MKTITAPTLGDFLSEAFPEVAGRLNDERRSSGLSDEDNVYTILTMIFVTTVLVPAMAAKNSAKLSACFDFIENLLASPDDDLLAATDARVLPTLLSRDWLETSKQYSGPLLQTILMDRSLI